jgi:hypothetical protein
VDSTATVWTDGILASSNSTASFCFFDSSIISDVTGTKELVMGATVALLELIVPVSGVAATSGRDLPLESAPRVASSRVPTVSARRHRALAAASRRLSAATGARVG